MDVYTKTTSVNAAGQQTTSYTKARTIKALYQSMSSERRTYPYVANIDEVEFFISYKDAAYANYNNKIQNEITSPNSSIPLSFPHFSAVKIFNFDRTMAGLDHSL